MSKKDDIKDVEAATTSQGPQKEESQLENENPSILSEQSITVDGVIYREKRSLYSVVIQDGPDAGKVERVLVHTRSMGDKTYTVHKIGFGSDKVEIEEVLEENKMNSLELAAFQEVWRKNCHLRIEPRIGQQETGSFKIFCKKLLIYEGWKYE